MGTFNTITADIHCPDTGEVSTDTEVQIRWQERDAPLLDIYRIGDGLPGLLADYNNAWVRTDYICRACSPQTKSRDGAYYIRTEDQQWNIAFVLSKLMGRVHRRQRNTQQVHGTHMRGVAWRDEIM